MRDVWVSIEKLILIFSEYLENISFRPNIVMWFVSCHFGALVDLLVGLAHKTVGMGIGAMIAL